MTLQEIALQFVKLGFAHVIPLGFDHILFVVSICMMNESLRSTVIVCTLFTIAHSLSLALAATNYIAVSTNIVEPLIALSVLVVAVQNIVTDKKYSVRWPVIFLFGLVHGIGFAAALKQTGFPQDHFLASVFFFNVGVELAQMAVIAAVYLLLIKWFSNDIWYRKRIVYPVSGIIACIACYWIFERLLS